MNNVILFSYPGDIFLVSFFKQILTFLFAFKKTTIHYEHSDNTKKTKEN